LAFGVAPSFAQSTFGTIVGTVKDSTGALMPGVVITIQNIGTSVTRSTMADESASYSFPNLEPGTYKVTMMAPGFQLAEYTNIQLLARQTIRIDGNLAVATQNESVSVVADAVPAIATEVSSIAETKTSKELLDLPIAIGSRALGSTSPITTLTTQVGVQVDNGGSLSVAGSKPSMLSVSVDGISTMNVRNDAAASELFPSFGTIAEIRVSEVNNAAEFGGVSDITTVSKGGTNQYHGGLSENHINTALNARNPFSIAKTPVIMNNYGAFGGGPIKKDKTFLFASFEGLQLPRSTFLVLSVPSVPLRNGDLSALSGPIYDPQTGQPFKGNQIDPSRFSAVSKSAMQYLWPTPNTGAPNAIANNYAINFPTPISSNQGDFRVDQNINSKQTMFVRGTYKDRSVDNAPSNTTIAGATHQPERDVTMTLAHNFIITPRLINELRLGASDWRVLSSTALSAGDIISKVGVQVPDPPSGNASPTFSITGFTSTSTSSSSVARSRTIQVLDNLSWSAGAHSLKFGGDIRGLSAYFSNVFASNRAGRYTFNGSVTNKPVPDSNGVMHPFIGNPFAAFLLGIPDTTGLGEVIAPDSNGHAVHYAFYAQDDWKPSSRLTINYGMRWEYHPPFSDHLNNIAVFKPDAFTVVNGQLVHGAVVVADKAVPIIHPLFAASIAPTPIITASQAGLPQQLHTSQKTSFGPRIGFAWRATADGKTVIRGGYGRFIEAMLGTLTSAGWAVQASDIGIFTNTLVGGPGAWQSALSFPNPLPANLAQPGTQDFELSADINYRDPSVHQWNLTFEREVGYHTGVRISYDGSHGSNLGYTQNLAQIPSNTIGFAAAKGFSPYPLFSKIAQESTGARSNYNALTIAANKRFSDGLQFGANYVFTKNLSNGQGYAPSSFASQAGGTISDPQNLNLDYGNVAFTRRHRFLSTFLYELPVGRKGLLLKDANKVVNGFVGGWQFSGVLLYQTGPFMTVLAPGADPQGVNFANLIGSPRADINAGVPLYPTNKGVTGWINKQAFAIPLNNIGRQGSSPISSLVGPGTQAVSLSLFKTFNITEGIRFQLGAAASNAFNHPNYTTPGLNYGTGSFGTITNVQNQEGTGPRQFQITSRVTF
jgi:hypothetical protein